MKVNIKRSLANSIREISSGFKGFECLKNLKAPIGHGGLICFVNALIPLAKDVDAIPVGYL